MKLTTLPYLNNYDIKSSKPVSTLVMADISGLNNGHLINTCNKNLIQKAHYYNADAVINVHYSLSSFWKFSNLDDYYDVDKSKSVFPMCAYGEAVIIKK